MIGIVTRTGENIMEMNHILIVEDDKDIREGVGIYLKSQGYEVFILNFQ